MQERRDVKCPFYVGDDGDGIVCEGLTKQTRIIVQPNHRLIGKSQVKAMRAVRARYCCNVPGWQHCPIAIGLGTRYYEEDDK